MLGDAASEDVKRGILLAVRKVREAVVEAVGGGISTDGVAAGFAGTGGIAEGAGPARVIPVWEAVGEAVAGDMAVAGGLALHIFAGTQGGVEGAGPAPLPGLGELEAACLEPAFACWELALMPETSPVFDLLAAVFPWATFFTVAGAAAKEAGAWGCMRTDLGWERRLAVALENLGAGC